MRTFLQTIIVSSIILGLSSCGLMMFGAKDKEITKQAPKEEVKQVANEEPVSAEVAKEEVKVEVKEDVVKEALLEAAKLEVTAGINDVFYAAKSVVGRMGLVTVTDKANGSIQANVRSAKVTVLMVPGPAKVVDISVNAIKDQNPDVELSSEILNKIKAQLAL